MLLFFAATAFNANAQTPPPACNIIGPLVACATANPADTTHDFIIYIEVARSTPTSVISYSFESNSAGAFIRKDKHGTVINPQGTGVGVTNAQALGVYKAGSNTTFDTLVVFPGTSGYEFNLQVNDTTQNRVNNTCECSKSVSISMISATLSYPPIACFGGNTQITVTGSGASGDGDGNVFYYDSIYSAGQSYPNGIAINPNPNDAQGIFSNITAGTYNLTIYSAVDGCEFDTSVSISQPQSNPVVLNCPSPLTVASCQTQDAVNTEFTNWLATVSTSGGTNSHLSNDNTGAPTACGGSTTVTFTVTSDCQTPQSCSATFTVPTAPTATLTPASDFTATTCQTQEAINAAYAAWLSNVTVSGGCSPQLTNNNPGAPLACGGNVTVTFSVTDYCLTTPLTTSATFTVPTATPVTLNVPDNKTVASCQTQGAVNAEFNAWLAAANATGGCNTGVTNNYDSDLGAPAACGGSMTITFTASSDCQAPVINTSTFTVPTAPTATLTPASDFTAATCQTQDAINAAYAAWLANVTVSGGCSPQLTNNSQGAPLACGGSVTVTFSVTDYCLAQPLTTSATFTVPTAPTATLTPASDNTVASCQTQDAVNAEYAAWLANVTVSGGCSPQLTNNSPGAPLACGGSVTVTFTATDYCLTTPLTTSATFTVPTAPTATLTPASDFTATTCQTQEAINAVYAAWLANVTVSGGCSPQLTNNSPGAPLACGGSVTVTFTATDYCLTTPLTTSATFTVPTAPTATLTPASDFTTTTCQTQEAVNAAYAAWLANVTVSGGCSPQLTNNSPGAPLACGGSVTVTFTATDYCLTTPLTTSATFTVPTAPTATLTPASDNTVASCQTQAVVNAEYAAWLANVTVSGGCSPQLTNNSQGVPSACGGSATVTFTVTDYCLTTPLTTSATFTVPAAPALILTPASDFTATSCQTQDVVNAEYASWINRISVTGGCGPQLTNDGPGAPLACGGSVTVTFAVTDYCLVTPVTTSATFTVPTPTPVNLNVPDNNTVASCQTQGAVNAEFNAWLAAASATGGCNTGVTNNYDSDLGAPAACGGSMTITFTASSDCQAPVIKTSTFTVPTAPTATLTPASDNTVASCQTQDAVNAEYAAWLANVTVSGGCSPQLTNNSQAAPLACGGSATVTFTVTDYCLNTPLTTSATFTVPAAPTASLTPASDNTVASCQTQDAVNAEYAAWLANVTVSGGCNPQLTNNSPGAPLACGGSVTVTFTATDYCLTTPLTTSATFSVPTAPTATLTPASDFTVTSCQTQEAINAVYATWLANVTVSGGCSPQLTNNSPGAPLACGGNVTVTFTATDYCLTTPLTTSATFTVPTAPTATLTPASDKTVASCQTQDAVNAEYAAWLASVTVNGGCSPQLNNNGQGAPLACGGSVTVTFIATDYCLTTPLTTSATFTVTTAPTATLTPASDFTAPTCQTQDAINAAYTSWLNNVTVSGGCSPQLTNNSPGAPLACGGNVTVTFTATDNCLTTPLTTSATFTVPTAPTATLTPASDYTAPTCQTQDAINAVYAAWLANVTVSGGCSPQLTNNSPGAPLACGGSVTVTFTATDYCLSTPLTTSATFTVPTAPTATLTPASDYTAPTCQTQDAINAVYAAWLANVTVSGGCSPQLTNNSQGAPLACGGSATVTFTVTDYCLTTPLTTSATFTVPTPTPVNLNVPDNNTVASCQTQGAVNAEFNAWLAAANATGGCNVGVTNNYDSDLGAPAACGGSMTITFTVSSDCQAPVIKTSTFTVPTAPTASLTPASDNTVASCQTQDAVNAEYAAWLANVTVNGGCSPQLTNNSAGAPLACGGSVTVTFTATDYCLSNPLTTSATFTVPTAPTASLTPASDFTTTSCQTQDAVNVAYAAWLANVTVSGGCSPQLTNNSPGAPLACGGSVTVTFTATDYCLTTPLTTSATFTVPTAPTATLTPASNLTVASCQTQEAVNAEYAAWLANVTVSGGCSPQLTNNGPQTNGSPDAPLACGGSVNVTFQVTDYCLAQSLSTSATFTIPTAPTATLTPANDLTVASCQTQDAVNAEYAAWLANVTVGGGCSPQLTNNGQGAPLACGGSVTVTFTATDYCLTTPLTTSATFTVPSATPVTLNAPANDTVASFQSQDAVNAEFAAWLASANATGGCNVSVTNNFDVNVGPPAACGGSVIVIFTATSDCQSPVTSTDTFTVPGGSTVTLTPASDKTVASCQTQDAVNAEYTAWINAVTVSGGNNPQLTNNGTGAPLACGGSVTVTFTVTDYCLGTPLTTSATFTVPATTPVTLNVPADNTVASCQTQGAVNAEFNAWLAAANATGGCNTGVTNNYDSDLGAPAACGGTMTITFTASSDCQAPVSNTSTFTVPTAPTASVTGASDLTVAACQTQDAVNAEYTAWLASVSTSGGCSPQLTNNNPGAPLACGGSVTVTFTVNDYCLNVPVTASATFTVPTGTPVTLNVPDNKTVASCQTQGEVNAEFNAWLAAANATGGCNVGVTNNYDSDLGAPAACGGTMTITFTASSDCQAPVSNTSTFTVPTAPIATLTPASDNTVASCQTQDAVNAEYAAWLANVTVSGGCSPQLTNNSAGAPLACGGSVTVTFSVTDYCLSNPLTTSATFTVPTAPTATLTPASDQTAPTCQTQDAINAAYAAWLANVTVTGGCSPQLTNNSQGAPLACGGSATVTFTVTDYCLTTPLTTSATFTVPTTPTATLTPASDLTVASCQTQDAVNAQFAAWLANVTVTGGCSPQLTNNSPGAPLSCGGSVTVTFTATDNCHVTPLTTSATFTVPAVTTTPSLTVPQPLTVASCQNQDAVNTAFANWLATARATGGCNGSLTNDNQGVPASCGGSTLVNFTYNSGCGVPLTGSATFTVGFPDPIVLTCAQDLSVASCQTQDAVNTEFSAWLATASGAGGCNGQFSYGQPTPPAACGGSTPVTFQYIANGYQRTGNLIVNGDFSQGDYGFISDYDYVSPSADTAAGFGGLIPEGVYAVDSNAHLYHPSFNGLGHGGNGSFFMVINGAPGDNTNVWSETINVSPNTEYEFSTWVTSVNPANVAALNFSINGNLVGNQFLAPTTVGDWIKFQTTWNSGNNTSANISIVDQNIIRDGNDFGLDDISFAPVTSACALDTEKCTATFTVPAAPTATLTPASDNTVASCQTQDAVNAEYAAWLANVTVSGGCSPQLSNNGQGAPLACGGSVTVTFTVTDYCLTTPLTTSATFTVPTATPVTLNVPNSNTVASCQTQGEVNAEFLAWLATANATGGCNTGVTNDYDSDLGAPAACGGTITVNFTASSDCQAPVTNSATFTVPAAPRASITNASNLTVNACQTQDAVNTEYNNWLASVGTAGGCSPQIGNNNPGAPLACGGSVTVIFTLTDYCLETPITASATFTVPASTPVTLNVPDNNTVASCQTQGAVNAEFAAWLAQANATGGCNTGVTNNYDSDLGAPAACGGSLTITFTASSDCQAPVTNTATFTVPSAPTATITGANNLTASSCQTQDAINATYAAWLANVTVSGGCSPQLTNNSQGAPLACGGSATVTFQVTDYCLANPLTTSATFTVPAAPTASLTPASDFTAATCQTQDAINAAYAAWLANVTVSGGCNPQLTNNSTGAPLACGGAVTVTFTATDNCLATPLTTSATFTVPAGGTTPTLTVPVNLTVASCQSQDAANTAFANWLATASVSGGCNGSLTNDNQGVPASCGGSTTVNFTYTTGCGTPLTGSATFTVAFPDQIVLTCAQDLSVASCQSQDAVNTEFNAWLATAGGTGGCNGQFSYGQPTPPAACGGSTPVTFQYIANGYQRTGNLIVNGDFSQGDYGFTSDYDYISPSADTAANFGGLIPEGAYAVDSNAGLYHPQFYGLGHGGSGSFFMIINGAPGDNTNVWSETINGLVPNTEYEFSTWVTTVNPANVATLNFSINGDIVGNQFSAPATVGSWIKFQTTWNSGNHTSANISIVDQNIIRSGNDFGLDDISFASVNNACALDTEKCTATFTVPATTPVTLNAPGNNTVASCQTQGAVNAEFNAWLASANATGGCNTTVFNNYDSDLGTPAACGGSVTVLFTTSSDCQAPVTSSATFTVTPDLTTPVITLTAAGTLPNNPTADQIAAAFGTASVTDNCTQGLVADGTIGDITRNGCTYSVTKSWTVFDQCGKIGTNAQTLTFTRDTMTVTCSPNTTLACNAPLTFTPPTVTDNCSTPVITIVSSDVVTNGNVHTRTWSITDGVGNTATCSQSVTVNSSALAMGPCSHDNLCGGANTGSVSAGAVTGASGTPTYTWVNSSNVVVGTTATVTGLPAGTYTLTVSDACTSITCSQTIPAAAGCNGYRTETMGGWGAPPHGGNAAAYLYANFASAFPSGLTVGCTNKLTLTKDTAVTNFLPSGGTPSALPAGTLTNPTGYGNTFAGQVVALGLALGFDAHDPNFASSSGSLASLTVVSGPFAGMTVQQVYTLANNALGGCGNPAYTIANLNDALTNINQSYDDGNLSGNYLTCSGAGGLVMGACSHTNPSCNHTCGGNNTTGSVTAGTVTGANGSVTYKWANSSNVVVGTTATVNGLPAGTYNLTVTDNCSSATCSQTITEPVALVMGSCSSTNASCNHTCGSNNTGSVIAGTIVSSNGTVSYVWKNSAGQVVGTTATVTGLSAGTYTLTASDNCSSATCTVTITEPAALVMGSCSHVNPTCGGGTTGSVTAGSITSSNGTVHYSWKNASGTVVGTTATVSGLGAGTYTLTASDNCSSVTCSQTITAPASLVMGSCSATNLSCNHTCGSGNTGSVTAGTITSSNGTVHYSWKNASGTVVGTSATVTGLAPGTYTLTASDNCSSTTCSVTITEPAALVMGSCSATNLSCNHTCGSGNTGSVTAGTITSSNGTVHYSWKNSSGTVVGTSATVTGLAPGTYTLTASDNCSSATCSVTITEPAVLVMGSCSHTNPTCGGGNTGSVTAGTITSSNGTVHYSWKNASGTVVGTSATVTGLGAGTYTLTASDNCSSVTCSQTITAPAGLVMGSCSATNLSCNHTCGSGNTGSVTAGTITSSNGTVHYSWKNSSGTVVGTSATVTGLAPGTYTLTASDNCSSTTCSVTITEPAALVMGACSAVNLTCNHTCGSGNTGSVKAGTITSSNGTVHYSWKNASGTVVGTTATVTGLPAGTYTLTASDNCSSATCSETITEPAALVMGACSAVNLTCNHTCGNGNTGSVKAGAITSSNGSVSYSWKNSSGHVVGTTATVTGLGVGTYTLTASDNCSSVTCSETITEPAALVMGACSAVNLTCNHTCGSGNTGSVKAGAITSSNGTVSYSWKNSAGHVVGTTATVTGLGVGTYTLTASDNCSSVTCSETITEPAVLVMGACSHTDLPCNPSCGHSGNTGSVTAGSITSSNGTVHYSWKNSSGNVVGTTATVTGLGAGTYTLTASDNCSSATCSQTIGAPAALAMGSCSKVNATCGEHNGSVTAGNITSSNGTVHYSWKNSSGTVVGTTATVSGLGAGTYNLTASDNCSSVTCSETITSTGSVPVCNINPSPCNNTYTGGVCTNLYLGYGPQSLNCNASCTGGSSFTYSWAGSCLNNNRCSNPCFTPTQEGNYTCTVTCTNEYGCSCSKEVNICVTDPRNGCNFNFCHNGHGYTLSANQCDSYLRSCSNDQLGFCGESCGGSKELSVTTPDAGAAPEFDLVVYPNPFTNMFHLRVQTTSSEPIDMKVLSVTGQLIDESNNVEINTEIQLGDKLANGIYFVEVKQGDIRKVVRMVKQD